MMSVLRFIDSPISWAIAGFAIGLGLGVTTASAWLVAVGLGFFVVYLKLHGQAHHATEGRLFAGSGVFMMSWLVGFVVRGIVF